MTPQETCKTIIIHDRLKDTPKFRGFFHGLTETMKAAGFKGIYKGPLWTVMKQSSNQAIRFMFYEKFMIKMNESIPNAPLPVKTALSGALAGAISCVANNPVDVVKTNLQGLDADKYKNGFDCFM